MMLSVSMDGHQTVVTDLQNPDDSVRFSDPFNAFELLLEAAGDSPVEVHPSFAHFTTALRSQGVATTTPFEAAA